MQKLLFLKRIQRKKKKQILYTERFLNNYSFISITLNLDQLVMIFIKQLKHFVCIGKD